MAASPVEPTWAIGRANDVLIFGIEQAGAVSKRDPFSLFLELPHENDNARSTGNAEDVFLAVRTGNRRGLTRILGSDPSLVHVRDSESKTPLHSLAAQPMVVEAEEMADLLLRYGAEPNARDSSGATPLHWVSCRPWGIGVAEALLRHGADPNVTDDKGCTPWDSASRTSAMVGPQMLRLAAASTVDSEILAKPLSMA